MSARVTATPVLLATQKSRRYGDISESNSEKDNIHIANRYGKTHEIYKLEEMQGMYFYTATLETAGQEQFSEPKIQELKVIGFLFCPVFPIYTHLLGCFRAMVLQEKR